MIPVDIWIYFPKAGNVCKFRLKWLYIVHLMWLLQANIQICPEDKYFWPSKNGCYSYYNCSTDSSSYITNPCDGFSDFHTTNLKDKFSDDCSSYILCGVININNNDFILNLTSCCMESSRRALVEERFSNIWSNVSKIASV